MSVTRFLTTSPDTKESLRKFAEGLTGWQVKDTGIKSMRVRALSRSLRRRIDADICVGEELSTDLSSLPHESVLAIFESNAYLVVTPDRNSTQDGTVYIFEPHEVTGIHRE